ncbi:HAD-superfamily hydrolase, subfamily IA, variant 1 [Methylocella silvestris BL2]|uniref:HAD-superfamily hydrolase, subfamily IA, variant 1 n=1 Tax=Methylocella silvestris (strain DSM 15510 / CIP 108128 / LMG 27833 / NCIMB 13906 / BL2) TaxID=395965 RepID=B8ERI7_METSB|nr:HAD-IA family hydrolase [Methylocella silvestris]ACK51039.1 HAD-superfamily hydrolase, subfamily IA, variant 1 [Methylocella silvestris BL2]
MKLVIFDIDGTLVDSQAFILEAQRRAFAAHAMAAPSREASLAIVGLSLHEAFSVLAGPDGPIESLSEAYRAAWAEIRANPDYEEPFYPGAREAVATLAENAGVTLGVATGKARRGVDHLFARTGWADVFRTVQTSDDHPSKPAPNMILAALAEIGAGPATTLMIGDTSFDMEMARAAGVRPIGVAWGYHDRAALEAAGAERIVADFAELLHFIGP